MVSSVPIVSGRHSTFDTTSNDRYCFLTNLIVGVLFARRTYKRDGEPLATRPSSVHPARPASIGSLRASSR